MVVEESVKKMVEQWRFSDGWRLVGDSVLGGGSMEVWGGGLREGKGGVIGGVEAVGERRR